MRLRLALVALVLIAGMGPGRAAGTIPPGLAVTSAFLSKVEMTKQTVAMVTVTNGSTRFITGMIVDCTAIGNDGQPQEVTSLGLNNVSVSEVVYGQAIFENKIESGSRVSCRVSTAY